MEKKLNEFMIGESGVVKKVLGEGRIRKRLFDESEPHTRLFTSKALFYFYQKT